MKNSTRCVVCATIAFVSGACLFADEPTAKKSDSEMKKAADNPISDTLPPPTAPTVKQASQFPAAYPNVSAQNYANPSSSPKYNGAGIAVGSYGTVTNAIPSQYPGGQYGYNLGPSMTGISQPSYGAAITNSLNNRPMSPEETKRNAAFLEAVNQLRNQKTEEDKENVRENLTKLVSEQLDADLLKREEELAAIEKRTQLLRAQLEERKAAKPEMLKMLVMLIDNPQMGIGIPVEWMQTLMGVPTYSY